MRILTRLPYATGIICESMAMERNGVPFLGDGQGEEFDRVAGLSDNEEGSSLVK